MADKMITTYNSHQSPTTDDKFFMVGASEEYLINYDLLASAILDKLTTKTYGGLNNSTVINAILANAADIDANEDNLEGRYKSYTASTDSIDNIYETGIYFIGNSVDGKPLGTTGTGTNGVLLVGGAETQNANIAKMYIYASQNTAERKGVYVRTFAGTTDYGWIQLAIGADVQNLSALLQGRQYSSIAAMYPELISLLAVNQGVWCTATGDLIASLTNSEITKVCRVMVIKADSAVLDYMLFAPGSNAIYIGRINSTSSITNRNRFALTSDVATNTTNIATNTANIATNTANIATNTANIATNTSNISTLNTNLATLAGKVVKTTLSTTQTSANATAETYNYQTISGLSDYAVVLVNVNCANLRQTLTFVNGDTDPQYLYEINGNNKIRGGYSVDWTNNRVRVRYLSAAGAYTYQNVYFSKVVGFIKQ